ncbi:hypothetical protein Tco_0373506 [Tanacetum coccineum]
MTDAKEMWDAIKSRFGGNDESKKMQKYILKQQFEGFSVSNTEGLHKGYDKSLTFLPGQSFPDNEAIGQTRSASSLSFDNINGLEVASSHDLNENEKVLQEDWAFARELLNQGKSNNKEEGCMEFGGNQGWEQNWTEVDSKALVTIDGEGEDWDKNHSEVKIML